MRKFLYSLCMLLCCLVFVGCGTKNYEHKLASKFDKLPVMKEPSFDSGIKTYLALNERVTYIDSKPELSMGLVLAREYTAYNADTLEKTILPAMTPYFIVGNRYWGRTLVGEISVVKWGKAVNYYVPKLVFGATDAPQQDIVWTMNHHWYKVKMGDTEGWIFGHGLYTVLEDIDYTDVKFPDMPDVKKLIADKKGFNGILFTDSYDSVVNKLQSMGLVQLTRKNAGIGHSGYAKKLPPEEGPLLWNCSASLNKDSGKKEIQSLQFELTTKDIVVKDVYSRALEQQIKKVYGDNPLPYREPFTWSYKTEQGEFTYYKEQLCKFERKK